MKRQTFLRWLTRFSELLDTPRAEVCRDAAYFHYQRGDGPEDTFKAWARWPR